MKKLLTSLATFALIGGTLTSTTAWSQAGKTQQNQTTHQSWANETAQDIANKLAGKTIILKANFWVGKDIANYLPNLRAVLVQQGLLTKDEANDVSCGHLIFAKAASYPACIFTVIKDGQKAVANDITLSVITKNIVHSILTYNQVTYVGTQNGLWESFDNGKTFVQSTTIPSDYYINNLYAANSIIYAETYNGVIYQSTDNGKTFAPNSLIPYYINNIYAVKNVIYVGSEVNGLWESTDNGKTFAQIETVSDSVTITSIYAYNNVIYVGTNDGLYESLDNGKTFTHIGHSQIQQIYAYNNVIYLSQSPNHVAKEELFESFDNGKIFTQYTAISGDYNINNIYAADNVIYVGTGDGLYESYDNGKTFVQDGHSQIHELYSLNNVLYLSQYLNYVPDGLYESTDKGETFRKNASIPGNYYVNSIAGANSVVYAGTDDGLYESTDNGKTFNLKI